MLLGVASIWDSRKGLEDFLKLERIVPERYQIILVGLKKEQIQSLPNRVTAIERTNSIKELRELYGVADIFVNPTHEDNYPTTNLEARACGTPVITYNTGGSPESAGDEALVIDAGNVKGLMDGIEELTNKFLITNKCKEVVKDGKYISYQVMAKKYISLYENL